MYICICHGVTNHEINRTLDAGASTMKDLRQELNVATTCGRCASCVKGLLKESLSAANDISENTLADNNYMTKAS